VADERELGALRRARDVGLRRLKALTALLALAMAVLAGAVAALAAGTVPGRKVVRTLVHRPARNLVHPHRSTAIPPPPPLPPVGSNESPSLSAPAQPPAAAPPTAPPVAVSGGS
jgi:hypothetical protein